MYALLSELLSDHKGDVVFSCFGLWHLCWLIGAAIAAVAAVFYLRKKGHPARQRFTMGFLHFAFALYIADFFLMPFAYGEIDVEKLPFHVCTTMCVMCFWSRHNGFFGKFAPQFALLGFVSNLVYLIYPAGVMWHQVHPLSYRVIQTLLFHAVMTLYGLLALSFDPMPINRTQLRRNFAVILLMTQWAMLGNALYADHYRYNWFFVTRDPFNLLPERIAPYIMPLVNIVLFFLAELLVCAMFCAVRKCAAKHPALHH